jgi:hypothetical protein
MSNAKCERLTVPLDPELRAYVERQAERQGGRSAASVVRQLIAEAAQAEQGEHAA